ncbi:hypothetical protein L596_010459 [Steinernema carpocapsae]|uniref:Granulins domain-containing protein n=1 Tax=Steinernema carpocapsae TaxID=34508 RepID=A0A4U5PJR5_STECR|nr:hypothetical protein L596_010459 [Steinernema carpocapsae]
MKTLLITLVLVAFASTALSQTTGIPNPCGNGTLCIGCAGITCCPLNNAVCCASGLRCCPAGTTCDALEQYCIRRNLMGEEIRVPIM